MKRLIFVTLFILLLGLVACGNADDMETRTPDDVQPPVMVTPGAGVAIIATDSATLRREPDVNSERLGTLNRSDVVEVLGKSPDGDWRLVRAPIEGSEVVAWVVTEFLAFVTPTPAVENTVAAPDTPTATNTPSGPDTPTATNTPGGPDTPTATNTPGGPDTPTATNTPGGPDTPTATNTPGGPDTPTATNTPGGPDTPTATNTPGGPDTPTATNTPGGPDMTPVPLSMNVFVSWELHPSVPGEALATVFIDATGGDGHYTYYRDEIPQNGSLFQYQWRTCRGNPVSFRVDSGDGQTVRVERFEQPPCPTATPGP